MKSSLFTRISNMAGALCLAGIVSACSSNRGGDFDSWHAGSRTDVTDSSPGTPRGDRTSADPAESSSQGAGSRNMVGQPGVSGASAAQGSIQSTPNAAGSPITDITTLKASGDVASLTGRPVHLSGVKVQVLVGPQLIAVGSGSDEPLYVKLTQPNPSLREGEQVTVNGIVREVTGDTDDVMHNLTGEAAHVLGRQPFFVEASSVQATTQ